MRRFSFYVHLCVIDESGFRVISEKDYIDWPTFCSYVHKVQQCIKKITADNDMYTTCIEVEAKNKLLALNLVHSRALKFREYESALIKSIVCSTQKINSEIADFTIESDNCDCLSVSVEDFFLDLENSVFFFNSSGSHFVDQELLEEFISVLRRRAGVVGED
jgi:hypothetical protein